MTAHTVDAIDELAGVRVPDPYRWLEDGAADDVQRWQRAQHEHGAATARAWPGFAALRELVDANSTARIGSTPTFAGGHWFRTVAGDGPTDVVVADEPYGEATTVFRAGHYLSWYAPSPDGRVLAVGLCTDGSEQNTITLVDVASGVEIPGAPTERLMDSWSGGVAWLPDSSGFYVTVIDGPAIELRQHVLLHRLGAGSTAIDVPWTTQQDYRMVLPTRDGQRLVAIERLINPIPVAVAELEDPADPQWTPFVTGTDASAAGHLVGDRYLAVTDFDAPRGRLVAIDLTRPAPADWVTLVPESDAAIRAVAVVGESLYLSEFVDTYARVRVVDFHGAPLGEVPLPGRGAIAELPFPYMTIPRVPHPDEHVFAFSTLTSSWGVYRHRPGEATVSTLEAPAVVLADATVEDHWASSPDGTRIPYHLVRPAGSAPATPQPMLIYAYGGFNAPWVPQFPGAMAAFVAAGGTFVHAHLRGGAEFGRDWWHAGRQRNKQNGYDDLYAIAEQLIATGRTTSELLALTGGSNGGLMSGVAVTQRPDLWRVVVPRVPLLDLLGACREPYGRYAVGLEFADLEDPEDVRRMLTFSPYHLVEEREYPAVYLDAGATDPRCSPWHARKFGARLQAAQRGDAPIVVRIWENVGHGWATDKKTALEQNTAWLAFVMARLGMTL